MAGEHHCPACGSVIPKPISPDPLMAALQRTATEQGVSLASLCMVIRIALTGSTVTEPIPDLLRAMGRDAVLAKLANAQQQ